MSSLPRRINPSPCQCMSHHATNRRRTSEASNRSPGTQKDPSAGGARPALAQIGGQGLADIPRKRQLGIAATPSTHRDQTAPPIQILQSQRRNLAAAQTQSRQKQ